LCVYFSLGGPSAYINGDLRDQSNPNESEGQNGEPCVAATALEVA